MSPKRQQWVVMHCDLVEFSRLTSQNEDATFHAVRKGFEQAALLVSDHDGTMVNTAGDSLLAVFPAALAAAQAALGLQQYFALTNRNLPGNEQLRARIGIHAGAVVVQGDQAFGNDVNIAARLQEIAPPGGICLSQSVRNLIGDTQELRFESIGVQTLRHISQPVSAFLLLTGHEVLHPDSKAPPEVRPRVLVLPFSAPKKDSDLGELGEALSVNLISALSRFRELFVFAPHSVLSLPAQSHDQRRVDDQLRARFLVEASLKRHLEAFRLTINLVEMPHGHYLWSERYDLTARDLAITQDEITDHIVTALVGNIEHSAGIARSGHSLSLDYNDNIRARHLVYRMRSAKDLDKAKTLFRNLGDRHPEFASAHSGLALSHLAEFLMGWASRPLETLNKAAHAAQLALELDPSDSGAHAAFGVTQIWQRDHDRAMTHLDRAVELNPNDTDVIAARALGLIFQGRPIAAFAALENVLDANPYAPAWYFWALAISCYNSGQYRNAVATLLQITSPNRFHRRLLAASYAQLGEVDKATSERDQVMIEVPTYTVEDSRNSQPYEHSADVDGFIEGLLKAQFPSRLQNRR
jgi:class 3 adenylate cyclase/tetratricopeptide (TPR) repeat protein